MRSALLAGLVAGVLVVPPAVFAAEGSALRGLKAPRDLWEKFGGDPISFRQRLPQRAAAVAFDLAPRTAFSTGRLDAADAQVGDTDFKFGLYQPLGRVGAMPGEGNVNPIFDSIPKYTLYSQVMQPLGGGFGLGIGMRRSEYNFSASNLVALSAEQHLGSFRGAYTLYSNRSDTIGTGTAQRFQLNYAYGDRNTVGLAYTTGRDIDNLQMPLGLPLGVSPSDVRDVSLSGRHWLSTNWALTYDVQSQESYTRRQGLRLGVSRSF